MRVSRYRASTAAWGAVSPLAPQPGGRPPRPRPPISSPRFYAWTSHFLPLLIFPSRGATMLKPSENQSGERTPTARGERAKDLVCGMDVNKDGALTHSINDRTYYFCTEECRDAFKADPAKFVK